MTARTREAKARGRHEKRRAACSYYARYEREFKPAWHVWLRAERQCPAQAAVSALGLAGALRGPPGRAALANAPRRLPGAAARAPKIGRQAYFAPPGFYNSSYESK
jgi:hypothetical protein